MRRFARLVVPLALAVVQACTSSAGSEGASGSPLALSPSPSVTASPAATTTAVQVTLADDQRSISVHVGDDLIIALGEQYTWQLEPPDGVVLAQPVQAYLLRQGVQAVWLARAVGRSAIKASGTTPCPARGQPCPSASAVVTFNVTVEVEP